MTTEPAKTFTSVTGEVYELADPREVEAMIARAKAMTPGKIMKVYRKCSGLKQFEAAAILGVTTQMLSQWENDRLLPTTVKAREIAEKLELPMVTFLQRVARAWLVRDGLADVLDVVPLDGAQRYANNSTAEVGTVKDIAAPSPKKSIKKGKTRSKA